MMRNHSLSSSCGYCGFPVIPSSREKIKISNSSCWKNESHFLESAALRGLEPRESPASTHSVLRQTDSAERRAGTFASGSGESKEASTMRDEAQGPEDCMEAASVSTRRQMDGARGDVRLWAEHQPGGSRPQRCSKNGQLTIQGPNLLRA